MVFGDRGVEIGVEAECFDADLVMMPGSRPGPMARMIELARRLLAGQPASEPAVPRVWALRPEPMV